MTIRKKIFTAGAVIFIILVILAVMNIRMHQRVVSNLQLRDQVNHHLAQIRAYVKWENDLVRLISEAVASGHSPPLLTEQLAQPPDIEPQERQVLVTSAQQLAALVRKKQIQTKAMEARFETLRKKINTLYYQLDEKIATVLALIQMDQVLGKEAPEKSSLAPYVLKSLNQLTLIALNSLISRSYTDEDRGVVARNRRFLTSQLHILDADGTITGRFDQLFEQIERTARLIPEARQTLTELDMNIAESKIDFDAIVAGAQIEQMMTRAESEVITADASLAHASRRTLFTEIFFLIVVPILVVGLGILGLNKLIIMPITHLVNAMRHVEGGHFDVVAQVYSQDEIGKLAHAFNTMAGEIKTKVTALGQLNQSLKESESKYRTLVENVPQSIFLKNIRFEYVSCNHRFARDLSVTEADIIGKTDYDLFPKPQADKHRQEDEQVIATQNLAEIEESHRIDGRQIYILKIKTPVFNAEKSITGVLGIYSNITKRKEAETERERLIAAIEHTTDSIVITDIEGTIQYVNPSFEHITGYTAEEAVGQNPRILKSGVHDEAFYRQIWQTITSGQIWQGKITNKRKDGALIIEEASISPVFNQSGQIVSFVAVRRDITEEIKMEEKLRQAQKMEAIGTLAGGIAHDFNNILFPIVGLSEMLAEDLPPNSPEQENAAEILKAGQRGSELVKQILSFSRQSEHKMMPVRIQNTLKEVLKLTRSSIPTFIRIENEIQSDCGMVLANPVQLHQIAMNLITNAYHATEHNQGEIHVQLKEVHLTPLDLDNSLLQPGGYAVLTVADNGCGIDPGIMEKIFDPYFTTKAQGKGTGLGLSMVYGMVKEHGGDIRAYSELGHGSTFQVYLPLLDRPSETVPVNAVEPVPKGNEHLLLVDDEPSIIHLQRQMLERLGYSVTSRTSSLEALQLFQTTPDAFDAVITDMAMPNMTGDQLAREIKAIAPALPIILCTGFSERINAHLAESIGINGFLLKPVISSQMAQLLRKVLDEAKLGIDDPIR